MSTRKLACRAAAVALLASLPLLSASAQTTPQTPNPTPAEPPAATRPDAQPMPPKSTIQKAPGNASATNPPQANALVGLTVFSSDGSKLGAVHSVSAGPDGKVTAIRIKSGGFLGLGAKLVAIPEGKFTRTGDTVQLGMTADEVSKLPEVKEQS